ncbi:hypothetical protein ACG2LH_08280 [Zhouia sp. PK063]|uniref:hypothetical protein n=1 Tax=Zhouia sp. PK063 TaxID=3373602 RepID=UPI0037A131E8
MILVKKSASLPKAFALTLGILFLYILIGLFLDGAFLAEKYPNIQIVADIVVWLLYLLSFRRATKKVKTFMVLGVLIAIGGEYLFSLGFEMYTYRLGNVPWYVPLGHTMLYITAIYFCKAAAVRAKKKQLEKYFMIGIAIYATGFLIFLGDIYGFILTVFTLLILWKNPRERLFYLTLYIIVAYLEIIGTSYNCWHWPPILCGEFGLIKSSNPPCGISFWYFGLELGSLFIYKLTHKTAWRRMKNIRFMREERNEKIDKNIMIEAKG